jgi:hypothetical protein
MGGEVTYQPGEACGSLFRITFGSAPVPAGQRVPS